MRLREEMAKITLKQGSCHICPTVVASLLENTSIVPRAYSVILFVYSLDFAEALHSITSSLHLLSFSLTA